MENLVYVGIGSNLGDPIIQCQKGIDDICTLPNVKVTIISSLYKTSPVDFSHPTDWFINGVIELSTQYTPEELLKILLAIEVNFGRVRNPGTKNEPRPLDLDILFFGQQILNTPLLTIPHPRLHERRFVLEPLKEIAPNVIHPLFKKIVCGLYEDLKDSHLVQKLESYPARDFNKYPTV